LSLDANLSAGSYDTEADCDIFSISVKSWWKSKMSCLNFRDPKNFTHQSSITSDTDSSRLNWRFYSPRMTVDCQPCVILQG
jgi:hypothetical protein